MNDQLMLSHFQGYYSLEGLIDQNWSDW